MMKANYVNHQTTVETTPVQSRSISLIRTRQAALQMRHDMYERMIHKVFGISACFVASMIFFAISIMPGFSQDLGYSGNVAHTNRTVSGTNLTFNVRVTHMSGGATGGSYLGYYVWPDPLGSTKYYLGQDYVPSLSAGGHSNENFSIDAFGRGVPPGSYDLGFVVDHREEVAETNENNNTGIWFHGDELVIPASPNLTPSTGHQIHYQADGNIKLTIKIKNNGNQNAGGSYAKYYLSSNNIISSSDTYIGQDYVAPVNAGATATETITFDPNSLGLSPGSYFVGYVVDANDAVSEWNELSNDNYYAYGSKVTVAENKPDLVPILYSVNPTVVGPGGNLNADARVENNGTAASTVNTKAGYYLSTNTLWDGSDVYLDENDVDPLAPGAGTPETESFNIPGGTTPGTYYILYIADHTSLVSESNEGNNIVYKQITVASNPDYIAKDFTASKTTFQIGENISLNVNVKNQGSGNGGKQSQVGYFLSDNNFFNAGDYWLGSSNVEDLNPGQQTPESENVTIPSDLGTGNKYLLAVADYLEEINESNEGNNTVAIAVTVNPAGEPDLVPQTPSLSAASVIKGNNVTANVRIKNIGSGGAGTSKVAYYLSSNSTYDGSDIKLGEDNVDALPSGDFNDESESITIPGGTSAGSYYILFRADFQGSVSESNEGNNVTSVALTVTNPPALLPDLTVELPLYFVKPSTSAGSNINLTAIVKNIGAGAAPGSKLGCYLSTDMTLDGADTLLDRFSIPALVAAVGSESENVSLGIPASTPLGDNYILFVADYDGAVAESNEGNNLAAQIFEVKAPSGPGYVVTPTAQSAVLYGQAEIDGIVADANDWIAAFDNHGNIAGAAQIQFVGGVAYINLPIYGDDPSTGGTDEGMGPGETFSLQLYDASEASYHDYPTATKVQFAGWTNTNGTPLPGYNDINTIYNFLTSGLVTDTLFLNAGWNLISLDVSPADKSIASVFAGIASLEYVTGFEGSSLLYDAAGPAFLNTLTEVKDGSGYWVKVGSNETLIVSGTPIPSTYKKDLDAGWNLVAYVPSTAAAPANHFSSLIASTNLEYVTGFDGGSQFYDPNGLPFLNTLASLKNGYGYWVRVNNAVNGAAYRMAENGQEANPSFMFINGQVEGLGIGESVEVKNSRGEVITSMEVLPEGYLMTKAIYGDDINTSRIEGLEENETLSFTYKNQTIGTTTFQNDRSVHRLSLKVSPLAAVTLYPNPVVNQANIRLDMGDDAQLQFRVVDLAGRQLSQKGVQAYRGFNEFQLETSRLQEGMYILQITTSSEVVATKKFMVKR